MVLSRPGILEYFLAGREGANAMRDTVPLIPG